MTTLTDFLLARIAEDEALAVARDEPPHGTHQHEQVGTFRRDCPTCLRGVWPGRERFVAECEAKRRIVQIGEDQIRLAARQAWDNWRDMAQQTLAALALPYADHPDYREEWRA